MTMHEAWQFFSSPYHLNEITPDFFHVTITSNVPENIYAGLMIRYQMKAVFNISMDWLSEVCHCDAPHYFVYQQRVGPFKFWSHEVRLTETDQGIVLEDIMFYAMPFAWFGDLIHWLLIKNRLNRIFDTRRDYLQQRFGG